MLSVNMPISRWLIMSRSLTGRDVFCLCEVDFSASTEVPLRAVDRASLFVFSLSRSLEGSLQVSLRFRQVLVYRKGLSQVLYCSVECSGRQEDGS